MGTAGRESSSPMAASLHNHRGTIRNAVMVELPIAGTTAFGLIAAEFTARVLCCKCQLWSNPEISPKFRGGWGWF
jgi:hypothetical protein